MSENDFIHDSFFEKLKQNESPVSIFLRNGIQLVGVVNDFDGSVIVLQEFGNNKKQLIYKSSISTVMPRDKKEK